MARRPTRDLTVGALFALALVILALAVMAVGGESGLFLKRSQYTTVFPDATGLLLGAPVRMAGVQIGTVTEIRLPIDPSETGIEVQLGIDPDYAERIRKDSWAALRILQLLTNEKFVEISPGSAASPPMEPNARIPLLTKIGVLERGETIAEDLSEITGALKNILGPMERGEGLLGEMLQDPEFGREGIEALRGALDNIYSLTSDMLEGKGAAGRLLYDESLASSLDDLGSSIESFASIMQSIERREGLLGELLDDEGAGRQAMLDLQEAAASLKRTAQRLEAEEGLLGRLLNDPEYSEALAGDLRATLSNVAEITRKINDGEGTLGALVNERVLHDGAEELIAGVNDSKFARWLARHYQKRGIQSEEQAAAAEDDE